VVAEERVTALRKSEREALYTVSRIEKARRDPVFWERLQRLAEERNLGSLDDAVAGKYLELLGSEDLRVSKSAADTLMNIRGAATGDYSHLQITNHKVEINDNRVPEEVGGISLEVLRTVLMGGEVEFGGDFEGEEGEGE
jgi:hypothetical protein